MADVQENIKWESTMKKLAVELAKSNQLTIKALAKCGGEEKAKELVGVVTHGMDTAALSLEECLYWVTRLNNELLKWCA